MIVKEGQLIRLKKSVSNGWTCPEGRTNNQTATVRTILTDGHFQGLKPGQRGLVLHQDLRGCRYWNEDDVTKA